MADHRDMPIVSNRPTADFDSEGLTFTFTIGNISGDGAFRDGELDLIVANVGGEDGVVDLSSTPGIEQASTRLFVGNLSFPDTSSDWFI